MATKKDKVEGTVSGRSFVLPGWVHEGLPEVAKAARIPAAQLRSEVDTVIENHLGAAIEQIRDTANPVAVAKRLRRGDDEALDDLE